MLAKGFRALALCLAAFMLLTIPVCALAATLRVSTYAELIDAAANCNPNDIIELQNDITRGASHGTAKITASGVTVRSSEGNTFLINNDPNDLSVTGRLLEVGDSFTQVDGFTLENVNMSGGVTIGHGERGGALYVYGDDATIAHCTFTDNHTEWTDSPGGAVYIQGTGAKVENSFFEGNFTQSHQSPGGGIYISGDGAQVVDSTFEGNFTQSSNSPGGGAAIAGNNVQVTNATFTGNHTEGVGGLGGGAAIQGNNTQVTDATFTGNHTEGVDAHGGGAYITGDNATIDSSLFDGNQTTGAGTQGGGVYFFDASSPTATIKDTDFANNQSTSGGGAIHGTGTDITIWGDNYYTGNTPQGTTEVDGEYIGIQAQSVTLDPDARVIDGVRPNPVPAPLNETQIVGAGPNNRASRYVSAGDLTVYSDEVGQVTTGTLPAGTEVTVIQISGGMAATPGGYVSFAGLARVTGQ